MLCAVFNNEATAMKRKPTKPSAKELAAARRQFKAAERATVWRRRSTKRSYGQTGKR
jgi:hypothetical protein